MQAANADAFARSFRSGTPRRRRERPHVRRGHGDARDLRPDVRVSSQHELDELIVLSEDELAEGVRLALRATHNLAEGAGGAALAAALRCRDRFAGQRVVAVMSGGNLDAAKLRWVLQ